jgi:hypothetical protein
VAREPAVTVHELAVMDTATWHFRDHIPLPQWFHPDHGSFAATFDPFPAYPHDLAVVADAVEHVARCCPPIWNVQVWVADREEIARSNGHSNVHDGGHYEGDDYVKDTPTGLIVLSGKRVPPHPALTRYLAAHEYGHNVEYMLAVARGAKHARDDAVVTEYAALRGLPDVHHGSGGRWHDAASEVFACDFRLVVCGVEPEFWPHPGIPRPEDMPGVAAWWAAALATLDSVRLPSDTPLAPTNPAEASGVLTPVSP